MSPVYGRNYDPFWLAGRITHRLGRMGQENLPRNIPATRRGISIAAYSATEPATSSLTPGPMVEVRAMDLM